VRRFAGLYAGRKEAERARVDRQRVAQSVDAREEGAAPRGREPPPAERALRKAFLLGASPITKVDRISKPLLIGQGANDPRVKQAESDRIVAAMQGKHLPVTYVLYPDEGHGFARPENRKSFSAIAEIFLAQCLGGPYEPIGADLEGSTLKVPAGRDDIATLAEALGK
jgi:pimeloyl-ACP methyl ester carboxylesterase